MGSARSNGNTRRAADRLLDELGGSGTFVDLSTTAIKPFAYGGAPDRDQFLSVVHQMLAHQHIVFATPVYWYSMSGLMKTMFDRLTDLLTNEAYRPLGRSLAGRDVWVLATGTDEQLPNGFEEPFVRTAAYFDMVWKDVFYVRSLKGAPPTESQLQKSDALSQALCESGRDVHSGDR